jgi:hypothetical protein
VLFDVLELVELLELVVAGQGSSNFAGHALHLDSIVQEELCGTTPESLYYSRS